MWQCACQVPQLCRGEGASYYTGTLGGRAGAGRRRVDGKKKGEEVNGRMQGADKKGLEAGDY